MLLINNFNIYILYYYIEVVCCAIKKYKIVD
jgi:hypothetical protein